MTLAELLEWVYNLPIQTLTDELKDDIAEKIEEYSKTKQNDNGK